MMSRLPLLSILLLLFCCGRTSDTRPGGFFPVKEFGKWGYINSAGEKVIKCQFDDAHPFSEGLAAILIDTMWGFIDTTGQVIIKPKFHEVTYFSDGLCNVAFQSDTGFVNAFIKTDGSIAFTSPHFISPFAYSRATMEVNDEVYVIDKSGRIVFNTHYPYGGGSPLQDGTVHVWTGDSTRYYDANGNLFLEIEGMGHSNFKKGMALVQIDDEVCFINKNGEIKMKPERPDLTYFDFSDGLAQVVIPGPDHTSGFIDATGMIVIPIQYNVVNDFKEGLASFVDKDGWGFIDREGKVAIKAKFEQVGDFSNGLCRVKQNHQWGYINKNGEFVWTEQTGHEYSKLDFSKWKLDTFEIIKPNYVNKFAGSDNYPRKKKFPSQTELTLQVDTTDLTVYSDKYLGYKLYLINPTNDTINLPLQDGWIKIIQQARNKNGEWQDIENFINSFCSRSYYTVQLGPDEYQIFATPVFKGPFKTQLRFKLEIADREIYSNVYTGRIHYGQFLNPEDKDRTGVSLFVN